MFARLVRFYGVEIRELPAYEMNILARCIPLLRAEESQWQANRVRVGMLSNKGYKGIMRKWEASAKPVKDDPPPLQIHPQFEDWYKRNGIPYIVRLAADN